MANNKQLALEQNINQTIAQNRVFSLFAKNPDLMLAAGVLVIMGLLLIPLPPFMLDILLAVNISISVLILLISLYLRTPLEFSSFPTILLLTTLFRLGLNVASTRLILGQAYAGHIIHAFGTFVIQGNYVVGVIIFIILVIINFVVIIKGSSRIAEVTARFTLDALPGKQMSIDAELNAGYIDEETAKKKRENLSKEADFFGSMDGASKFIRGDAIAGIIISVVNILAGFVIGMAQLGMGFAQALSTYTILTIGDGLVSQIPALLISVSAGLVVTRSASANQLDMELGKQFGAKPKPLFIVAAVLLLIAFLPGFPFFPFFLLAVILSGLGYLRLQSIKNEKIVEEKETQVAKSEEIKPVEQPIEEVLKVEPIELELGYNLIQLVDEKQGGDLFKRITNIRKQLAQELGLLLPAVRVRDNLQLDPEEYVVKIRNIEIARNKIYPNRLLAMNPGTAEGKLDGLQVTEPVFGLPATWIQYSQRESAELRGFTVVEASTVLNTHLTELLKRNADKLLTRQDVKKLIDNLESTNKVLIDEIAQENLPLATIQKVLQNLLIEGIPIRDLPLILESLLDYYKVTKNTDVLTEYVRHNLSETIKKLYQDDNGVIHVIALDPEIEDIMTQALQSSSNLALTTTLGLPPAIINNIQKSLSNAIDELSILGYMPVVICSAQVRPYFFRMIHPQFPMVNVISYTELPADTEIEVHSRVAQREAVPQI
ncbi:MAG: flagellar biosynthesis protein FlhA [Candidatus Kapabacteria bacterium]|nr:flagellar biosynthesis protein FlhA [Candidatus Kapabacteria bacterium]